MPIVSCWLELDLPSRTLKEKRSIVKHIVNRVRQHFNVAASEMDLQDVVGSATICFVTVSNDYRYAEGLLEQVVAWVERERPDVVIVEYAIEEV